MLQLPQTAITRRLPVRAMPARKAKVTKKRLTALEAAIANHKHAMRLLNNRERELSALYVKHPELADYFPTITFTDVGGKVHTTDTMDLVKKAYPPSLDSERPDLAARRKEIEARWLAIRKEHDRDRRRTGISKARKAQYRAWRKEIVAFKKMVAVVPTTKDEVRRYSSYVLRMIKKRVGGPFDGGVSQSIFETYNISQKEFAQRQKAAMYDFLLAFRAMARGSASHARQA